MRIPLRLREKDGEFVECLTPDEDKFRLYRATKKGERLLETWERMR